MLASYSSDSACPNSRTNVNGQIIGGVTRFLTLLVISHYWVFTKTRNWVVEKIEGLDDMVQSVEIASFNKI